MRIMITGADGQLGRALQRALELHEVNDLGRPELDVSDAARVDEWFRNEAPEFVIHSAALTDTNMCERAPASADDINGYGTGRVVAAASRSVAPVVVVSTNEVFDGSATSPIEEDAPTHPLNAYGHSKLLGEAEGARRSNGSRLIVVRTSWLYGEGGNHFVAKVIAAARAGKPLRFVTDEIATPTYVDDLAQAIRQLIELEPPAPPGIYHLTNEGEASRYEWACEILRLAGMSDVPVEPITTEELYASGYDGPRKPRYSVLANTRARALGITLRDWREALADYFAKSRAATQA